MSKLILKQIIENVNFNDLSFNWQEFDFEKFSKNKKLYDFQKKALENFLKILWLYYEKFTDYHENESLDINEKRKEKLFKEYLDWGLNDKEIEIRDVKYKFIFDYYQIENGGLSFRNFINRAGFWMATGSGKTLVIVKIIEFLKELMKRKEIPDYDILFLTHREDLINQFKLHLEEFNQENLNKIEVYNLKDYDKIKRDSLFKKNFVFYYKSDLFSDEEKEKIVNFKNYYNDGKWFIILDEAHKGDKEESKRQNIFSILSKNGFLFNFSATFDDIRDLNTTCFEYNLSTFIEQGYGKKIYISDYEAKAFKNDEFKNEEKQKIILKSLIILTYIKIQFAKIKELNKNLYHNPLLLVLVNSVNKEDADLKLFFDELENIAKGDFNQSLINQAKNELIEEFKNKNEYIIPNGEKLNISFEEISQITYEDILKQVFNSQNSGSIEISYHPKEKGEVAFKLKTSDNHFALIKTGDIPDWLKNSLSKFDVNHTFEEEKFFERINKEDSQINILLGSRVFYEGWDSNRPNVIMFINIGVGKDAKKFVLQSVGRGVRIEPIKDEKKRILFIKEKIRNDVLEKIKNFVYSIESLFIFGTNKNAIETIVKEVDEIKKKSFKGIKISLYKNEDKIKDGILLIPRYTEGKRVFEKNIESIEENKLRFSISENDLKKLKEFNEFIDDDRILAMLYDIEPVVIKYFRDSFKQESNIYKNSNVEIKNIDLIIKSLFRFWGSNFKEFEKLQELKDEIKHFENLEVSIEEVKVSDLKSKIENVKNFYKKKQELEVIYKTGQLSFEEFFNKTKELNEKNEFEYQGQKIYLKNIPNHYYLPLILSKDEKIDYIKHIIKTKSEFEFIEKLENYLNDKNNKFKEFDWWMFSKIDETLDEVYIPYYDYSQNKLLKFKPDFIFWLKKNNNYFIVFIDPKSTKFTDYQNKIDWYEQLFTKDNKIKNFIYNNLNCYIFCYLYLDDTDKVKGNKYQRYWFENFDKILNNIFEYCK
ncbi:MAG: DEAD/DEAH box helicase family protein [bacterium]